MPAAMESPLHSGGHYCNHVSSGPKHGLPMILGSHCLTLEGSKGDTCPMASHVQNAIDTRPLILGSQPRVLPRHAHRLPRQNCHHGHARHVVGGALNAYETCGQAAARLLQCSAILLTTHRASLQCPVTRKHSATEPLLCQGARQLNVMLRMGATWRDNKT
jgi:hypothetical protein